MQLPIAAIKSVRAFNKHEHSTMLFAVWVKPKKFCQSFEIFDGLDNLRLQGNAHVQVIKYLRNNTLVYTCTLRQTHDSLRRHLTANRRTSLSG